MLYFVDLCTQLKQVKKQSYANPERKFVSPVSETKIWTVTGVTRSDI